jgi:hypothetical protein
MDFAFWKGSFMPEQTWVALFAARHQIVAGATSNEASFARASAVFQAMRHLDPREAAERDFSSTWYASSRANDLAP